MILCTTSNSATISYVFAGRGSKRPLSSPVREVDKPDIEVWALTDVVFVEDIRCAPIGRVLKVTVQVYFLRVWKFTVLITQC